MSAEDQVGPYHAKQAHGQEAADTVAAVLKHAQERDKAAKAKTVPKKQPKWMLPLGINLAVFAVYLLIAPPSWVTVSPLEGQAPEDAIESMRLAMYLQSQRIEQYRIDNGVYPDSLDQLQSSVVRGVEYIRAGNSYQMIGTVGGEQIVYDSSQSASEFVGGATQRLSGS